MSGRGGGKSGIAFSLVGLLAVLVILGVTAAIAVPSLTKDPTAPDAGGGSTTTTSTGASVGTATGSSTTETTVGIPSESAIAACKADAQTVAAAVQDYATLHGVSPSAVTPAVLTSGPSPFLQSFPSNPDYAISIASGVVMVAAPKSAAAVPYGRATACTRAGP